MPYEVNHVNTYPAKNGDATNIIDKGREFSNYITKAHSSVFCAFEALREATTVLENTDCPTERREILAYLKDLNDEYLSALRHWEEYSYEFTSFAFITEDQTSEY